MTFVMKLKDLGSYFLGATVSQEESLRAQLPMVSESDEFGQAKYVGPYLELNLRPYALYSRKNGSWEN